MTVRPMSRATEMSEVIDRIIDNTTGATLFIGQVVDPTKTS